MTDVVLYQTNDGGEISAVNGTVLMGGGISTAVYLALFGGNEDDAGGSDKTLSWWGNQLDADIARHYRSKTQYLLRSIPAIPINLGRIKTAIEGDLAALVAAKAFSIIEITITIPQVNWINISVKTNLGDVSFMSPWEASI